MRKSRKAPRPILITNRVEGLEIKAREIVAMVRFLDRQPGLPLPRGELSIAFLSDSEMARLHHDYLGDPTPTDVLAFPGDEGMDFAGEICVATEKADYFSSKNNLPLAEELTLYLVHGILHLAGFDDGDAPSRGRMREREAELLSKIRENDLLPFFRISA